MCLYFATRGRCNNYYPLVTSIEVNKFWNSFFPWNLGYSADPVSVPSFLPLNSKDQGQRTGSLQGLMVSREAKSKRNTANWNEKRGPGSRVQAPERFYVAFIAYRVRGPDRMLLIQPVAQTLASPLSTLPRKNSCWCTLGLPHLGTARPFACSILLTLSYGKPKDLLKESWGHLVKSSQPVLCIKSAHTPGSGGTRL